LGQGQHIVIDPAGDLLVCLYDVDSNGEMFLGASQKMTPGRIVAIFRVICATLSANCPQPSSGTVTSGFIIGAKDNCIDINKGTVTSLELWFRVLHGAITPGMYAIPINEILEAVQASEDWGFNVGLLKDWFAEFWQRL
jgi:hypothetical protein